MDSNAVLFLAVIWISRWLLYKVKYRIPATSFSSCHQNFNPSIFFFFSLIQNSLLNYHLSLFFLPIAEFWFFDNY